MRLSNFLRAVLALSFLLAGSAFASVDPVTADPNTGANYNRYAYANNNPYRFIDPDGRQSRDLESIYKASGAQPPSDGNGPNLVEWGVAEVLCGFCDLNYTAPAGSGAVQPIATPVEISMGGATARAVSSVLARRTVTQEVGAPLMTTAHGAERIAGQGATRGGVLSAEEVQAVLRGGRAMTQADGAAVRISTNEAGRSNVVVSGERGVITTFRNLSEKSMQRLSDRYGWE